MSGMYRRNFSSSKRGLPRPRQNLRLKRSSDPVIRFKRKAVDEKAVQVQLHSMDGLAEPEATLEMKKKQISTLLGQERQLALRLASLKTTMEQLEREEEQLNVAKDKAEYRLNLTKKNMAAELSDARQKETECSEELQSVLRKIADVQSDIESGKNTLKARAMERDGVRRAVQDFDIDPITVRSETSIGPHASRKSPHHFKRLELEQKAGTEMMMKKKKRRRRRRRKRGRRRK